MKGESLTGNPVLNSIDGTLFVTLHMAIIEIFEEKLLIELKNAMLEPRQCLLRIDYGYFLNQNLILQFQRL